MPKSKIKSSSTLIPVKSSTLTQDESNIEFNITNDTPRSKTVADNSIAKTPSVGPVTPKKALHRAILATIWPKKSNLTKSALQNAKKRRERVQMEHGEVLTYEESLERLRKEEKEQKQKKQQKHKRKKTKKVMITTMILMLMKIFALHATKKTQQAMMRIQKVRRRSSSW